MKPLTKIFTLLLTATLALLFAFLYLLNKAPHNSPALCLNQDFLNANKNIVVSVGDSITHGVVSSDYTKSLEQEAEKFQFKLINAGINADLSITVLRRLHEIIQCQPKAVTILIGTNDRGAANTGLVGKLFLWLTGRIKWGDAFTIKTFEQNLRQIIRELKNADVDNIFLISLPLNGEDLNKSANVETQLYSQVVKSIAKEESVSYIALHETMRSNITHSGQLAGNKKTPGLNTYIYFLMHYYFSEDLDALFEEFGYQYLTDGVHLNAQGADLLSNLILEQLKFDCLSDHGRQCF